jgi:thioredoxin:protein disulfide reductase
MKRSIVTFFVVFVMLLAASANAALPPASPFQLSWNEHPPVMKRGQPFELAVTIRMPDGHYLYADDVELDFTSLEGLLVEDVEYPSPTLHEDPYQGGEVEVYEGAVRIIIVGRIPDTLDVGEHDLVAKLKYRGCSPKICFRPEVRDLPFIIEVAGGVPASSPSESSAGKVATVGTEESVAPSINRGLMAGMELSDIFGQGVLFSMLMVFLAGILTSLTPCVWPIIPVVLTVIGVHPHKRFRENLLLAASLTAGLILVYAVLGMIAVLIGKNLGFLFQQRWFLAIVVIFFIAMSLSMFGAFHIHLPRKWQGVMHNLGGEGYRGAFLAGMGTGLVASPCSGPVVAALLGYVALKHDYLVGFVLLIIYGLGMSLIIILLGTLYGQLAVRLKGGVWMVWVKRALGIMLLFPAVFYMGSLFGWTPESSMFNSTKVHVEWLDSEKDALKFAKREGRPVMVEFTANWCPPCRALDRTFFSRDDVVQLSYQLVPLRIDATVETDDIEKLVNRYRVRGWPTVIFLDPNGKRYRDLRVKDYSPEAIEYGMREAIKRAEAMGQGK